MMKINKKKLGIYLHIPFCLSKCPYCDFYSITDSDLNIRKSYTEALLNEIKVMSEIYADEYTVDTIFLGGGTPSILEVEYLDEIMYKLNSYFSFAKNPEITMELNPKTVDLIKLRAFKTMGFNRLSIGVQSLDDQVLKTLGRTHKKEEVFKTVNNINKAGFNNYSIDLMFAIPNQNLKTWEDTLKKAVHLEPEHISLYSLEVVEKTPFDMMISNNILRETSVDLDRKMYYKAMEYLENNGFIQYEISNTAKIGYESRHNLKYWNLEDYLGLGVSAHSYMGGERFFKDRNLKEYIQFKNSSNPPQEYQKNRIKNSLFDNVKEYVFTRLRTTDGVDFDLFNRKFQREFSEFYTQDILDKMKSFMDEGLVYIDEKGLRLTRKGMSVSNSIMCYFV